MPAPMLKVPYSTMSEGARAESARPATRISAPARHTPRGPKRSASMPPGTPKENQSSALSENTSETCAREAPNSAWNAEKNAAKEYAAPNPMNIRVKAASTTTQPVRVSPKVSTGAAAASLCGAARADGPQVLHHPAAHADVPVVEIDRRIAMARYQQHLLAQRRRRRARRDLDEAVLVRGLDVLEARALPHRGHAGIDARGLEPGVHDGAIPSRPAHHRGKHEQGVLEARQRRRPVVPRVVRIHERVGPGLDLVPGARLHFEHEGAAARAGDDGAGNAALFEQRAGRAHRVGCLADQRAP